MTQTADAFARVEGALTFFVNYYNSLAGFKSVVDRLTSFNEAIEKAKVLGTMGPKRTAVAAGRRAGRARGSPHRLAGRHPHRRDRETRACPRARARCSPGPRVRENRRCSAPSPASGRTARAASTFPTAPRDGGAAEALHPDRHAARRRHLSGGARHLFRRGDPPGPGRRAARQPARLRSTARRCGRSASPAASSSASRWRARC